MIKRKSKKRLMFDVLCAIVFIGIIVAAPFDFLLKQRKLLLIIGMIAILKTFFDYQIYRKAKLFWNEPKEITRVRRKAEIISSFQETNWLVVSILLILVAIPLQLIMPHWYYLPIIISSCIIFMSLFVLIVIYAPKVSVIMDENGIRPDASLLKHQYGKITSIEIIINLLGGYSLVWNYEGKEIIRGISKEIEIAQVKTLIEKSSQLELRIKQ